MARITNECNASINGQEIRAAVILGETTYETPDVISFNVRRARGQSTATFTASIKVPIESVDARTGSGVASAARNGRKTFTDNKVVIKAGFKGDLKTIFTGYVLKATINPVRTDSSKFMLNLSGKDVLWILEGQKVNRRIRTYKDGSSPPDRWGLVTGIVRDNSPLKSTVPRRVTNSAPQSTYNWDVPDVAPVLSSYGKEVDKVESNPLAALDAIVVEPEEA